MALRDAELRMIDVHLCFDATYLSGNRDAGTPVSSQLSLGVGLDPLPGCGPSDVWRERMGPDVSFVGSLGETRVADLREILRRLDPSKLALLNALAEGSADAAEAFEHRGWSYEASPCLYVDEVRSTRRRVEVLSRFSPESLRTFGGAEWARAPGDLARCYSGRAVHYGPDLASLYFHSRINLNVFHHQCVDSTNSRVYDVLAAGGFLLTEYRACLEREFEIGKHLVTFASPEEAREKAEYYLMHAAEREAIAREGQRHVLSVHTFAARCRRILELAAPYIA
jgi:hypothetical protein